MIDVIIVDVTELFFFYYYYIFFELSLLWECRNVFVQHYLCFHALLCQNGDIKGDQLRKVFEAVKGRENRLIFLPRNRS